jgi:alpha-ribazole phosphatase
MTADQGFLEPPAKTIYLLRHGPIQGAAAQKRYIGQQDLALNEAGLRQARQWAQFFAGIDLHAIHCSDLARCQETAGIIAAACRLRVDAYPALREVDLGHWEGLSFENVRQSDPEAFRRRGTDLSRHRPPGGESFQDLQRRAWPLFCDLSRKTLGNALIVSHAGVIRVLLCRLLGIPLANLFRIAQDYGALNIVELKPMGYRVQVLNLTPDCFARH